MKYAPYGPRVRDDQKHCDDGPPNFELLVQAGPARPPVKQTTLTQFCEVVDMTTIGMQSALANDDQSLALPADQIFVLLTTVNTGEEPPVLTHLPQ